METKQILMFFFITIILLGIIIKSSISQDEGEINKMKIFKKILIIFIIIGVVNVYNITDNVKHKILVMGGISILFTIFTITHSTGKYCEQLPNPYKFRLILESTIYILLLSALIWGSTFGTIFGFNLLSDEGKKILSVDDYESISLDSLEIHSGIDEDLDCPPETDVINLSEETEEELQYKRDCLNYYSTLNRREELDEDIYD